MVVVGIGEPPCSRIGSGAGEGIQGALRLGGWSISNTYPSDSRSARAPAVARGADTTSWTRPFLDIGEEKLLQPEWLLGLQGIEAGHDLTDEIEGPDLPDEIGEKPSAHLGFLRC